MHARILPVTGKRIQTKPVSASMRTDDSCCRRLKITLNLPPIEPRPPVPPRIYKRLLTHLDKVLPVPKARSSGTPKSKALASPSARALPSRGTPNKEVSLSQFRTPTGAGATADAKQLTTPKGTASILPRWIRPTVRYLCATLNREDGPDLGPTVMAGLESIIAPYRMRTRDEWVFSHLSTLLGAIYWFVSEEARLAPGEEMTAETSRARYKTVRKELLASLRDARAQVKIPAPARGRTAEPTEEQEAAFWGGWQQTIKAADLDEAITEVTNKGWLDSDWYRSIEYLRDKAGGGEVEEGGLDDNQADTTAIVQITKADTMLQEKFDYLSERRRAEYRQWKADILRRIDLLERRDVMDLEV